MQHLLQGNTLYLRMVEPHDAIDVMLWENNPENWPITDTEVPFSLHGMQQLIEQQQQFRSSGQLRFILCLNDSNESIGTVDLYDADFKNGNVSVGILLARLEERGKGYAKEALMLLIDYVRAVFDFHNVSASIQEGNMASINLFQSVGFVQVGKRINWFKGPKGQRINELNFQLCLKEL